MAALSGFASPTLPLGETTFEESEFVTILIEDGLLQPANATKQTKAANFEFKTFILRKNKIKQI